MFGEGFFRKTPEILKSQVVDAQETLGPEEEHALLPPSEKPEDVFVMSEAELKQKYALRFDIFKRLIHDKCMVERGREDYCLTELDIDDMKKWLAALNSLDTYIQKHHEGEQTLRGEQIDVFEDMRTFLEEGGTEGYVELPTGVGKTVLFTEFIEALNLKTLVVVPTRILVRQTASKIQKFAKDLDVGKVYSDAKEHGHQVTITTYDSFVSQVENGHIQPKDFDCVILDEVHESLTQRRSDVLHAFEKAIKIGFTATTHYSEEKHVGNLLKKEIHKMTTREAVEKGLLSSVSAIIVRTEADLSDVKLTSSGEYNEKELERAINIESRNKAAVDLYKGVYAGEAAVAYCCGIGHAEQMAKKFQSEGIAAVMISGNTPRKEQEQMLADFKEGKIKVLCNSDILIEGFDEPKASICLNLRPTRSRVDAKQRGGRVLRLDPDREDKHAYVVDFLDKGISETRPPIFFADVAGGAFFEPKRKRDGGKGGDAGGVRVPIIDIPGLEIVYDAEEVMRIVVDLKTSAEQKRQYRNKERTIVDAVAELEQGFESFMIWKNNSGRKDEFSGKWIEENGYYPLYSWCQKNTSLEELVKISNNERLKSEFVKLKNKRTLESALKEVEQAFRDFLEWQRSSGDKEVEFTKKWLTKNGYEGLRLWCKTNISLEELIEKSDFDLLKDAFTKRGFTKRTPETALTEFEQAYEDFKLWRAGEGDQKSRFNSRWLDKHGYRGVTVWCLKNNIQVEDLLKLSNNEELKKSFVKR